MADVFEHVPAPAGATDGTGTRRRGRPAGDGGRHGPERGSPQARRGGRAVREKYGRDYFVALGRKGGAVVKAVHGPDFYVEIGRKGGLATKRSQGPEHYARIGRKGGEARGRNDRDGRGAGAES